MKHETLNFIGLLYMTYIKSIHKSIQNLMWTRNEHQCSASLRPFDQSQHSLVLNITKALLEKYFHQTSIVHDVD